MDFGLFNLLQHRDRSKSSHDLIQEALDHTRKAEELGFSRVWFAEHHFSNYSLVPSPLMMCAYAAAITKRIRVGSAVVILPLHAPARLIAEIAMVDALSGGRLDLGVGSGYQNYEFERLGADIDKNKVMFHEMLDMIELGLRRPHFSYDGEFYKQKSTAVNVRSVQSPRPPIWIAGKDPDSHRRCARDGYIPFISGGVGSPKKIRDLRTQVEECYAAEGKPTDNIPLGVLRFMCISENRAEIERYVDGARYQQRIAVALRTRQESLADDYMVEENGFEGEPSLERIERNIITGNVDKVAGQLCEEIELYGPAHMNIYFQVGDVESKTALASMEALSTKVIPLVEKHFGKPLAEINHVPMPVPKVMEMAAE
jgi:alkanesulfonate monooxygenase SsuD/methylene tetrahydromethanopterin reductase-like flavin-dependent oxidoreductase (luciferase family)